MNGDKTMKALFAQQRAQIIHMKAVTPRLIPDSYAYAWINGVYPFFSDSENGIPDYPHENFSEHFRISAQFGLEVFKYIDGRILEEKKIPTFYELEERFGGIESRDELVHICRYTYLDGRFDSGEWLKMTLSMDSPCEAGQIAKKFDENDLFII